MKKQVTGRRRANADSEVPAFDRRSDAIRAEYIILCAQPERDLAGPASGMVGDYSPMSVCSRATYDATQYDLISLQAESVHLILIEMPSRVAGFPGEYLWELDIAQAQLLALADAVPDAGYSWRPVDDARPFSAVLVHIAAGNFALLHLVGMLPDFVVDLYGPLDGDMFARFAGMIARNVSLERTTQGKQSVLDLLRRSFDAIRQSFSQCSVEQLERAVNFFGEPTTVRRVYLRMLTHTHEHMGQAIAYTRSQGIRVPWPDPLKIFDRTSAGAGRAE